MIFMLLFKKELVIPILKGIKVETRRVWNKCMVKEGSIHKAKTDYRKDSTFALLYIKYVKRQRLKDMNDEDARKEGFNSLNEFINAWIRCYKYYDPEMMVYVIGFKVIKLSMDEWMNG